MNKTFKHFAAAIIAAIIFTALACTNPGNPPPDSATGSITGRAVYTNNTDYSGGILITLEQTDGLRSVAVMEAQRSLNGGASGARAISASVARSVATATTTGPDGSYTINGIPAGTYTLYATSRDSLEKAVTKNITVRANAVLDVGTLELTTTGSISGQIVVDEGSGSAMGFLVSVAGTSFMALTDSKGMFTINGIPAGDEYYLIVMKGNYTTLYTTTDLSILGGKEVELPAKNITTQQLLEGSVIGIGEDGCWYVNGVNTGIKAQGDKGDRGDRGDQGNKGDKGDKGDQGDKGDTGDSIVWKGEFASAPANPELYWAYFNTANGNAYIYNGTWELMARGGTNGTDGVSISWHGTLTSHPDGAQLNWAYYNSAEGKSYIYDGEEWRILAQDGEIGPQGPKGDQGDIPSIGSNGNWWVGDTDTYIPAQGLKGDPGDIPSIGSNGNWWIGDTDTTIPAQGDGGTLHYFVAFNSRGGNTIPSQTLSYGDKVERPANPTRNGYAFAGWYSDSTLTTLYDFDTSVTGNFILYAQWNAVSGIIHTVTFNSNGGTYVSPLYVADGGVAVRPVDPSKHTDDFVEWYDEQLQTEYNFDTLVTGDITLYAKWAPKVPVTVTGTSLADKLAWLQTNAASATVYVIEVTVNENIPEQTLSYTGRNDIVIILQGDNSMRTVGHTLNINYTRLFTVSSGVTLILDNNISLQNYTGGYSLDVVRVNSGGTLIMNTGSVITELYASSSYYGVRIESGGTFIMNSGKIAHNAAITSSSGYGYGGGVYVGGIFTMNDGEISGNTVKFGGSYAAHGGGVYSSGTFTMGGGVISGNVVTATDSSVTGAGRGGGAFISSGSFNKTGGTIYGYDENDTVNSNVVTEGDGTVRTDRGNAVFVYNDSKRKETTAGPSVNLGYSGGSFSGEWDN